MICEKTFHRRNQIPPPMNAAKVIALATAIASCFGSLLDALSESYKERWVRATKNRFRFRLSSFSGPGL